MGDDACLVAGCIWNAADVFPAETNPVGPWQFGFSSAGDGLDLSPYTAVMDGQRRAWFHEHLDRYGNIWKNTEPFSQLGIAPGQLQMHPPCISPQYVSSLMFTAPLAGTYRAVGAFDVGSAGLTSGGMASSAGTLIGEVSIVSRVAFDQTVTLSAGGRIRLWVHMANDSCSSDSTQVELTIELQ